MPVLEPPLACGCDAPLIINTPVVPRTTWIRPLPAAECPTGTFARRKGGAYLSGLQNDFENSGNSRLGHTQPWPKPGARLPRAGGSHSNDSILRVTSARGAPCAPGATDEEGRLTLASACGLAVASSRVSILSCPYLCMSLNGRNQREVQFGGLSATERYVLNTLLSQSLGRTAARGSYLSTTPRKRHCSRP
jgi:hypothetical protein